MLMNQKGLYLYGLFYRMKGDINYLELQAKYFTDPEFKKEIISLLDSIKSTINTFENKHLSTIDSNV